MISEADIDSLLVCTDPLLHNVYTFDCSGHAMPGKSHRVAAIAHQDVFERRVDFLRELRNTVSSWVYSKKKYTQLYNDELAARGYDVQNVASHIQSLISEKFRKGYPQGQFGELLLFNLLQHFFKAAPMLRKMPITTNPSVERHGADAIHFRPSGGKNIVFIGEAKTYSSKYKFKNALDDAVESILKAAIGFASELNLYVYDDFIDEDLREVAAKIKRNTLEDVVFELVCIVSYSENDKSKTGKTQREIEECIEKCVVGQLNKHAAAYSHHDPIAFGKIHFVICPFWDFGKLLEGFDA